MNGTRAIRVNRASGARRHSVRLAVLWCLDRFFPPNPSACMSAEQQTSHEVQKASATMGHYLAELGTNDVSVLDFGCGWGGETLWLATQVHSVIGIDVEVKSIEQARRALARMDISNCRFECAAGGVLPVPDNSVDAVFSTNTLEHVMDLDQAFSEIYRVLKPGGVCLSRFGPLFYSPHGYHLYWACQVPYAHLLFGLDAILHLRKARCGHDCAARSWQEMEVNGKRFAEFEHSALRAGFQRIRFAPIPVRGMALLAKVPRLRDLFIFGIDCYLRKPIT